MWNYYQEWGQDKVSGIISLQFELYRYFIFSSAIFFFLERGASRVTIFTFESCFQCFSFFIPFLLKQLSRIFIIDFRVLKTDLIADALGTLFAFWFGRI